MERIENYLDNAELGKHHFKAMFVSGMGFFTDAYDLFIIGIAISLIAPIWKLSSSQIGFLGSISLISALIGSFIFGRIADRFGRKTVYGVEAIIMAVGALLSAISPDFTWLLISRFLLGIGIGGDYPVSAVIMSEYSNKKDRGKLVGLVFSMQAVGLITGPLVALGLLGLNISPDLSWRIMLGIGAIPALMVIYLRRKIPESPRYTAQVLGDRKKALEDVGKFMNKDVKTDKENVVEKKRSSLKEFLTNKKLMLTLFGTAGSWFLMDYAYYGNTISTPLVLNSISSSMSLEMKTLYTLLIFLVFAVPGYILAIALIDKIGRKPIQLVGFAIMGVSFLLIGLIPDIEKQVGLFFAVYGISYLFTEFGPNTTTFVLPSELFPTEYRTTGHGISAGIGKVGAFVGTFLFPIVLSAVGFNATFVIISIVSFAGILTTLFLKEPKGESLESISDVVKLNPSTHRI
ncbi:MFS transporter [Athalassotoga saccharophila]|uniref:MFS transporter n=1 Tax=Athalassotoga saccharophila TaxID=1441386 RepID=UPI00137A25B9|nr:MFS transporter [Athalassotoga saccharophila]BBJ27473.1 putative niacin/nicotinamide transporter NaiP [Athalassotoga saccharophila]